MNDPRKDADIHALSGPYAVDALDDLDRVRFENHLQRCASCREEVAGLRDAAAQLSELTAMAPPASLRAGILDEISRVRPLPPEAPRDARPRARRWSRALVAVCAVAVVGLGVAVVQQARPDQPAQVGSATSRVLAAPDARSISVKLPGGATARVVHSVSEGKAVLVTSGMPQAPEGKTYELWLQNRAGDMVPAGLMDGGDAKVLLDGDATDATAAGITVEPAGGSEAPTSAPIALFDFAKAT